MKKLFTNKKILIGAAIGAALLGGTFLFYSWYWQDLPQAAIYFLNDVSLPGQGDTVMVFTPHCDDETLGAGGYIYTARKQGAEVWVVLATDCNRHGLEKTRYSEFEQATKILGVPEDHLVFLDFPDSKLIKQNTDVIQQAFEKIVAEKHPKILIAPHPGDQNADHRLTGTVVEAIAAKKGITLYQYLVHYPHFPSPERYAPMEYILPPIRLITSDKEWQRLMLSPEALDRKHEALLQYRTQLRNPFLHELLFGLVKQNELFAIPQNHQSQPQ